TRDRLRAGLAARTAAPVAQHRGLDRDLLGEPGGALLAREADAHQRVRARLHAAARHPTGGRTGATEEGVHDVAEAADPGEGVACARPRTGAVVQRIATQVDDLALLRVGQHLVGLRDLGEAMLGVLRRVDVRVQFTGQLAVGPLD